MGALTLCRWVDGRKVTAAYVENGLRAGAFFILGPGARMQGVDNTPQSMERSGDAHVVNSR